MLKNTKILNKNTKIYKISKYLFTQSQQQQSNKEILIIGGGPSGSFLAYILAKKYNYNVRVIERNPDLRDKTINYHDRSYALSLGVRGLTALKNAGLQQPIDDICVPQNYIRAHVGYESFTRPYSLIHNNFKVSISRRDLTTTLLEQALQTGKVKYEFNTKLSDISIVSNDNNNIQKNQVQVKTQNNLDQSNQQIRNFEFVLGADGYRSQIRNLIQKNSNNNNSQNKIKHCEFSLKSMLVPNFQNYQNQLKLNKKQIEEFQKNNPIYENGYLLNPVESHIWPQINQFCFLFPNKDGEYNINLCLPNTKDSLNIMDNDTNLIQNRLVPFNQEQNVNFEDLNTPEKIKHYLETYIPSLYKLVPDMVEQFIENPPFITQTIENKNWYYKDKLVIFGDASHGMTPYSGSGCNIAFSCIQKFDEIMQKNHNNENVLFNPDQRQQIFKQFEDNCLEDAQYSQQLQLDELQYPGLSQAGDKMSQKHNMISTLIEQNMPEIYMKKISMAFYSLIPHKDVKLKGDIFNKYVQNLINNNQDPETLDFKKIKQEITQELQKANLNINLY